MPGTAERFAELVTLHVCNGRTKSKAVDLAISEAPDSYAAWLKAEVKPSLVSTGLAPTADGFARLVKLHASRGLSKSRSLDVAIDQLPGGYRAWREAKTKPSLL